MVSELATQISVASQPANLVAVRTGNQKPEAPPDVQSVGTPQQDVDTVQDKVAQAVEEKISTPVDSKELEDAIESVNDHMRNLQRDIQFSVDDDSGRTIVKVVDGESQEVIRQIPSEEVLAIAKGLAEFKGMLLQEKA